MREEGRELRHRLGERALDPGENRTIVDHDPLERGPGRLADEAHHRVGLAMEAGRLAGLMLAGLDPLPGGPEPARLPLECRGLRPGRARAKDEPGVRVREALDDLGEPLALDLVLDALADRDAGLPRRVDEPAARKRDAHGER